MINLSLSDMTISTNLPAFVMAILNVTPDSFYEKSRGGFELARRIIDSGADIIDIGAESTRPGSDYVCEEEEIKRYVIAIEEVLKDRKLKENCRSKILNGFTVENMAKTLEKEFEIFAKEGSKIDPKSVVNEDLYKQYIMMYNQLDIRNYFPQDGGNFSLDEEARRYKIAKIKGILWENYLWRGFIKFLKATGIMKIIKKSGMKQKIRKIIQK